MGLVYFSLSGLRFAYPRGRYHRWLMNYAYGSGHLAGQRFLRNRLRNPTMRNFEAKASGLWSELAKTKIFRDP